MSQANVEIVRKITDAYRRGDWDEVSAYIDPHISVRTDPSWPEQRFYRREALLAWWRSTAEVWGRDIENDEIVDLGDRVLVRWCWKTRGQHSGIGGELRSTQVITIRDGRYTFLEYFLDHDEALKAVGLED